MRRLAAFAASLLLSTPAARAITFSFSQVAGDALTTDEQQAITTAGMAWSAVLSDPITINIAVGFGALGANILAETSPSYMSVSPFTWHILIQTDAKSADDVSALRELSSVTTKPFYMTDANAKAIGILPSSSLDATITFATSYTFSAQRNTDGSIVAGTYDLVGIAEHEIGHALGFVSGVGSGVELPLDTVSFHAPGVHTTDVGETSYFSLDDGASALAQFSTGGNGDYSVGHWQEGSGGIMDPTFSAGSARNITVLDEQALDVIGYDVVAVDEPSSLAAFQAALLAAWGVRSMHRFRRAKS